VAWPASRGSSPRSSSRRWSCCNSTLLGLLALWAIFTGSGLWAPLVNPIFLPSPVDVARAFVKLAQQGYQGKSLAHHFGVSFLRFGTAFGLCVLIGVPLGLRMAISIAVTMLVGAELTATSDGILAVADRGRIPVHRHRAGRRDHHGRPGFRARPAGARHRGAGGALERQGLRVRAACVTDASAKQKKATRSLSSLFSWVRRAYFGVTV